MITLFELNNNKNFGIYFPPNFMMTLISVVLLMKINENFKYYQIIGVYYVSYTRTFLLIFVTYHVRILSVIVIHF
jgi:hypothetical protein